MRGDGPHSGFSVLATSRFSPRAWGWSGDGLRAWVAQAVLPTCVGMVRRAAGLCDDVARSPHVRGDGPNAA